MNEFIYICSKIRTKLSVIFSNKPRDVSVILTEMDAKAVELRARAELDKITKIEISREVTDLEETTKLKIDDLIAEKDARNHELHLQDTKLNDAIERAERVAGRVENFTS